MPIVSVRRAMKDLLKRNYFRLYKVATRLGLVILPHHYYAAEPDILELERTRDTWSRPLSLRGIRVDLDEQAAHLHTICTPYRAEYMGSPWYRQAVSEGYGPGYGSIEAQALHAIVRYLRPARIIEIGSGVSTRCAFAATQLNAAETGREASITCIEPHPSAALQRLAARTDTVKILRDPVQQVPLNTFAELQENDIMFVDSSHVLKAGSDVGHIVLEILPTLARGVAVHFHDIYLPYAYQRDVLKTFLHNNETPLVAAFLAYNYRFQIIFCLSQLHYDRAEALATVFPDYRPQPGWRGLRTSGSAGHFPSALWLRVVE